MGIISADGKTDLWRVGFNRCRANVEIIPRSMDNQQSGTLLINTFCAIIYGQPQNSGRSFVQEWKSKQHRIEINVLPRLPDFKVQVWRLRSSCVSAEGNEATFFYRKEPGWYFQV